MLEGILCSCGNDFSCGVNGMLEGLGKGNPGTVIAAEVEAWVGTLGSVEGVEEGAVAEVVLRNCARPALDVRENGTATRAQKVVEVGVHVFDLPGIGLAADMRMPGATKECC